MRVSPALEEPLVRPAPVEVGSLPRQVTYPQDASSRPAWASRALGTQVGRRWTAQPGSRARAPSTAPGPGPAPAAGQRPSDHARPGGPGRAQPMGWRRPHDPRRREGVGRQAGRARCRAVSSPPLPPGREVSRRGPQCQLAAKRVLQPPAPGAKHGGRQGKRRPVAPGSVPAGRGPAAREPPAFTCRVDATWKTNRGPGQLFHLAGAGR